MSIQGSSNIGSGAAAGPSSGIPDNTLTSLIEDSVTFDPLIHAMQLNCGHTFNEETLKGLNICPICRTEILSARVDYALRAIVEQILKENQKPKELTTEEQIQVNAIRAKKALMTELMHVRNQTAATISTQVAQVAQSKKLAQQSGERITALEAENAALRHATEERDAQIQRMTEAHNQQIASLQANIVEHETRDSQRYIVDIDMAQKISEQSNEIKKLRAQLLELNMKIRALQEQAPRGVSQGGSAHGLTKGKLKKALKKMNVQV